MCKKPKGKKVKMRRIIQWFLETYGDVCEKKDSLYDIMRTNPGYKGLTHPMKEAGKDKETGDILFVPDFEYRYLS